MYETFGHTADLGLRAQAATLDELFAESARALILAILDDPHTVRPQVTRTIEVQSDSHEYLLFDWLSELLYIADSEQFLWSHVKVRLNEMRLTATVSGESCEPGRHEFAHEVKAITYHGLKVERTGESWLAEVIIDI